MLSYCLKCKKKKKKKKKDTHSNDAVILKTSNGKMMLSRCDDMW